MASHRAPHHPHKSLLDLEITVVSAKHLKNVNWRNGVLKPYAVAYLDPDRRSATKPDDCGSTRPVWNERITLPLDDAAAAAASMILTLDVFHSKPSETPKPFVGTARIPLVDLVDFDDLSSSPGIKTLDLRRPSGRPHGKVRIKVAIRERPLPPPPLPEQNYLMPTHAGCRRRLTSPAIAVRCESRADRMFVFGLGFVGRYIADQLKKEGWEVAGTCTSAIRKRVLEEMDLDAFIFDVHKSKLESLHTLQNTSHILISIPPDSGIGDPLLHLHKDLQSSLSNGKLRWLGYLSSTSVYGDCGGALVCEDYPLNPKSESAKSRIAAEKGWLDLGRQLEVPVYVFRLGGIYGPGRSALDSVIKQKSVSEKQMMRKSKLHTARIHVADIYQAIKASFDVPSSGEIYNVVDDDPAPREEVFSFAQALIQSRCPDMISRFQKGDALELESAPPKIGIARGEKQVSNARLKQKLGVELLYPSYKSGLPSILDCYMADGGTQLLIGE